MSHDVVIFGTLVLSPGDMTAWRRVVVDSSKHRVIARVFPDGLDLEICDNEFLVLLGPSGCGKTTTLNIIAGLEELSGGEIYFDDRLMNDVPPQHRNTAMVFQNYAIWPHLSVYENVAYGPRTRKLDGAADPPPARNAQGAEHPGHQLKHA